MQSAVEYLRELYSKIRPEHVVEIGADMPMRLAAQTCSKSVTPSVNRVSIVAHAEDNELRKGWWRMHPKQGCFVERVDGDARNLHKLVDSADVVVSHGVLYGSREDLLQWAAYHGMELDLTEEEAGSFIRRFIEAERQVIYQAHEIARGGRAIWFADIEDSTLQTDFTKIAQSFDRKMEDVVEVAGMIGENQDYKLRVLHSYS